MFCNGEVQATLSLHWLTYLSPCSGWTRATMQLSTTPTEMQARLANIITLFPFLYTHRCVFKNLCALHSTLKLVPDCSLIQGSPIRETWSGLFFSRETWFKILFIRDLWLPLSRQFLRARESGFGIERDTWTNIWIKRDSWTIMFCVNKFKGLLQDFQHTL